ncbi:hypothetical protein [Rhodococcus jostii]|uniref:hypothetical protein n=1 Tax=Rhodococcus jostii TaxID=132919 RepID=UPI00363F6D42
MTHSTKKSRRHRLLKLAYAPLVMAVAAGAICIGAGTGTAASTTTPGTTDAPQSGSAYEWTLINHTGQPIYGTWSAEMSTGDHSRVEADKDHAWQPGDVVGAVQYQDTWRSTTWRGRICYNGNWWDYESSKSGAAGFEFSLEADSAGNLFVYPHNGYSGRHRLALKPGRC